jgi:hypothetical protein
MSHSWQGDKALRIDTKRTEYEANEGGGGPSQSYGPCRPPAQPRVGIDKGDTIGPKPISLPPGPSKAAG